MPRPPEFFPKRHIKGTMNRSSEQRVNCRVILIHISFVSSSLTEGYHPLLRAPRTAGARNICVGFADVTRIRRESGAYMYIVCHANVTRKIFVRCASCSPRIMHMLREERTTRDVTFGPLCTYMYGIISNCHLLNRCVGHNVMIVIHCNNL
jgi:hypothetical protein